MNVNKEESECQHKIKLGEKNKENVDTVLRSSFLMMNSC